MLISVVLVSLFLLQVQSQATCKNPYVEQRLLADDVRYASPFYVIAMPKTPQTQEMDNVCYTYFENPEDGGFFHIMSVTYKNGSNTYYPFAKGDILDRIGIAEAKAKVDQCVYHDYTLKPICNVTVFILYRCFIEGKCINNIDVGPVPGVDVRVTLAASPKVSPECQAETQSSLRDTSALDGGDYILLPQKLTPNCITKYNDLVAIGKDRALGPKTVVTDNNDLNERFGGNHPAPNSPKPGTSPNNQGQNSFNKAGVPPPSPYNPYGHPNGANAPYPMNGANAQGSSYASSGAQSGFGGGSGGYGGSHPPVKPGQPMWPPPGHVQRHPPQWNGQTVHPGAETHYHIWQSAASAETLKAIAAKNPNVYYHVHSWDQPHNCCKCF